MSLVVISSVEFDPIGYVEIDASPDSSEGDTRRRVTRSSTLDGGAAFNDFGYSEGDRIIDIKWAPELGTDDGIVRLVRRDNRVRVSVESGVYLAAPEVYRPGGRDDSSLRLLVESKLSV